MENPSTPYTSQLGTSRKTSGENRLQIHKLFLPTFRLAPSTRSAAPQVGAARFRTYSTYACVTSQDQWNKLGRPGRWSRVATASCVAVTRYSLHQQTRIFRKVVKSEKCGKVGATRMIASQVPTKWTVAEEVAKSDLRAASRSCAHVAASPWPSWPPPLYIFRWMFSESSKWLAELKIYHSRRIYLRVVL